MALHAYRILCCAQILQRSSWCSSLCPGGRKPFADDEGCVHWPVLMMYPEPMQMDAIEDMAETDPLAAHLDVMFPPDSHESGLQWDGEQAYQRHSLQLYYLSHAAQPLSLDQLTEVSHHQRQATWPY